MGLISLHCLVTGLFFLTMIASTRVTLILMSAFDRRKAGVTTTTKN
jgi:hypothetical protein